MAHKGHKWVARRAGFPSSRVQMKITMSAKNATPIRPGQRDTTAWRCASSTLERPLLNNLSVLVFVSRFRPALWVAV